ncbi:hypothetical protein [Pseudalkalibacillus caeni]|uniref:DUF4145 domain-containing protein n=1 Tax=Exobacillus caeni TaxID=2574798 RepID=A0A5R9EZ19_9BACL|nr:hypothetical protein [Pseudalkalibacillus caeni]TLS35446.1 hypothetical protein FCL54_20330 [Pseudalkalibacillus caeni]
MRKVQPSAISTVYKYGQTKLPKAAKTECPNCGEIINFQLKFDYQMNQTVFSTTSRCSNCKESALFVFINESGNDEAEEIELYVYNPSLSREPLKRMHGTAKFPGDLERVYRSAVNVHNVKDWTATAAMSRRVLESISRNFLADKERGQDLAKQLEALPKHVDLQGPIIALGQVLGKESNLRALLDLEMETDEEAANLMIDLLDSLIEYLFILPQKLEQIQKSIESK